MSGKADLRGVLLWLAYDGAGLSGWAKQANARTVAGELEGAIRCVDPRATALRGVSRTDSGVHARGQIAAFDSTREISPRGWVLALSRELPDTIAVVGAASVPAEFEPRKCVSKKRYRYVVASSEVRDPFFSGRAWRLPDPLDVELMREEAALLIGTHDVAAFRGARDDRVDTVRTVLSIDLVPGRADPRCLEIVVEGDRFLYHMVRIVTGTLVDVGRGRLAPGAIQRGLDSLNRRDLGMTAPPEGLYLEHIKLDYSPADVWPASLAADSTSAG